MAAALALVATLAACAPEALPAYRVERRDFTHRVPAEGFLEASSATDLKMPSSLRHGGRVVWMAPDGSTVAEGDVVLELDRYEMEQRLEEETAELRSSAVERLKTEIEGRSSVDGVLTRRDLAGVELEQAQRFRRSDREVFSQSEILESEIREDLARTRQDHARDLAPIASGRARSAVELVDITRRKRQIEVDLARRALGSLVLAAPSSGVLLWSRDWRGETLRIGEQVFRGQTLGEIPDLSKLQAEVFVLEVDAGALARGQQAEVVVEAHPEIAYRARVTRLDPVAKRRFQGSPVQYVGVSLELESPDLEIMKPGQRVRASLVVAEEPAALVLPRQALFSGEEGYFVYLARDQEFVRHDVEVGSVAPGLAVVKSGLAEGDRVALEVPPRQTGAAGERVAAEVAGAP